MAKSLKKIHFKCTMCILIIHNHTKTPSTLHLIIKYFCISPQKWDARHLSILSLHYGNTYFTTEVTKVNNFTILQINPAILQNSRNHIVSLTTYYLWIRTLPVPFASTHYHSITSTYLHLSWITQKNVDKTPLSLPAR